MLCRGVFHACACVCLALLQKFFAGEDPQADEWQYKEPEPIQARGEGEGLSASLDNVHFPAVSELT